MRLRHFQFSVVCSIKYNCFQLIVFALRALSEASVEPISELTCSVALVGINTPFKLLDTHSLSRLIAQIYQEV